MVALHNYEDSDSMDLIGRLLHTTSAHGFIFESNVIMKQYENRKTLLIALLAVKRGHTSFQPFYYGIMHMNC